MVVVPVHRAILRTSMDPRLRGDDEWREGVARMSHKTPFDFLERPREMPERIPLQLRRDGDWRATSVLRTEVPKVCSANLGPRDVLPIPAPSGRPLTKGAFLQTASCCLRFIA